MLYWVYMAKDTKTRLNQSRQLKNLITLASAVIIISWLLMLSLFNLGTSIPCMLGSCSQPEKFAYLSYIPLIVGSFGVGYGLERGEHRSLLAKVFLSLTYGLLVSLPVLWLGYSAAWHSIS